MLHAHAYVMEEIVYNDAVLHVLCTFIRLNSNTIVSLITSIHKFGDALHVLMHGPDTVIYNNKETA